MNLVNTDLKSRVLIFVKPILRDKQFGFGLVACVAAWGMVLVRADDRIDFNRDVRPILAGKCFVCHGRDEKDRKANLRLDVRDSAVKPLKDGSIAIVPGKPAMSELLARISSTDDDEIMPPPKHGARLTDSNIATLKTWIEQGAPYAEHWAYEKPLRPALPDVKEKTWPTNEIDRFILARLAREGLQPSPQADRYALIHRVYLDLTGLPPTIAEADAFAHDDSPDSFGMIVDRLLARPAYGERWAQVWLDLARYADSQGFAPDAERAIWRWRDGLIQSLNANVPYDQFTVEQLAGDLLPNASDEQRIATGFNRNTLTNTEGGVNQEEFRSAAVVDRVNTTLQVWMASTFACCQCHNHKYDPFSQKDYYQLYAIFNSTQDANGGDDAPFIEVARLGMESQFAETRSRHTEAKSKFESASRDLSAKQPEWEKSVVISTLPGDLAAILKKPEKERNKAESDKLAQHFRSQSKESKELEAELKKAESAYKAVAVTTPVMLDGTQRDTFIHLRGNYEAKGDKVNPGLPSALASSISGPVNRLTLARWIASADNPLTARVAVNRLWEQIFGIGIVETSEDFGVQGEGPTHPELLDWLATEYVRLGWDTKKLIRLIVTSATYRQSSAESTQLAARDPLNRLLARGPRVRLTAETVRDQALFASGLLSHKMYGPPRQPAKPNYGLAAAFGSTTDWKTDAGEDRWCRAIYIRTRRNAPYPSMNTFDAPERTNCTIRRIRTNTPLQALVTLNDPCFVEAAQGLARRIVKEGGETEASRVIFAFRTCLTRPPNASEAKRLADLYQTVHADYAKDTAKAKRMATQPLGAAPEGMNEVDLAAWTVVSNVLMNLDETLARR